MNNMKEKNMTGYFVKFQNSINNTAKAHTEVLTRYKEVIWGQWSNSIKGSKLTDNTINQLNTGNFYLYALDKNVAFLKMHVKRILPKEEIVINKKEYLIPNYYNINTPVYAFYLIDSIEIYPPEYALLVHTLSSDNAVYYSNNVNGASPWRVYEVRPLTLISSTELDLYRNPKKEKNTQNIQIDVDFVSKILSQINITLVNENNQLDIDNARKNFNLLLNQIQWQEQDKNSQMQSDKDNRIYSVYAYYWPLKKQYYIGMTNNIERRRKEHENPNHWKGSKKYLYTLFSLVGIEDFEFQILHTNLTEEEAHQWEAKEIENHNSYFPQGLNERNESRYL